MPTPPQPGGQPARARGAGAARNRKRSWYADLGEELEFLAAAFTDFRYPKHLHETFAIGIIEAGGQRFATRAGQTVMPRRTLCVVNPGLVHWGRSADESGWRYRMIYPSVDLVARALDVSSRVAHRVGFEGHVIDDPGLYRLFSILHREAASTNGHELEEAQLFGFLRTLFVRHSGTTLSSPASSPRGAHRVREFLHEHWDERVSIARLATIAEVSETHVIRSFTRTFGMSPRAYQSALRIERSKADLIAGQAIAMVAARVGFYDQSHFHRHFVKIVGCTPGEFVKGTA
ncbi:MAG: AraC family transcriptional regulator [Myxococcota bacterium]